MAVRYGLVLWTGNQSGVSEAVALGVAADKAGWDGIFVPDELSAGYADPWAVLSAIAQDTNRIRLGTWITPLPHQQPWRVAHSAAAVDRLSAGRLMLGVGLGAPGEHNTFGGSYEPRMLGRRYDEALEVIVVFGPANHSAIRASSSTSRKRLWQSRLSRSRGYRS